MTSPALLQRIRRRRLRRLKFEEPLRPRILQTRPPRLQPLAQEVVLRALAQGQRDELLILQLLDSSYRCDCATLSATPTEIAFIYY